MKRKNILFIVMDQFRADLLFGDLSKAAELPNIKALMQDAVSFRNHWSVVNPCGPSRASLLTGQYALNHRSVRNGTPLDHMIPTVPRRQQHSIRLRRIQRPMCHINKPCLWKRDASFQSKVPEFKLSMLSA